MCEGDRPHPLLEKVAEMPNRDDEVQPNSPPQPPGLSQPTLDPPMSLPGLLTLPGTTDSQPFPTPHGKWRQRLRAKLSSMVTSKGTDERLRPYMERAEERADAVIGEILEATGRCGPIAETEAVLGARFAELAHYFLDHVDPDTKRGRSDILLARACTDTSRLNFNEAIKTSAAIKAMTAPNKADPLDAYVTVTPSEEPEPT